MVATMYLIPEFTPYFESMGWIPSSVAEHAAEISAAAGSSH
ncbi:MAG: hypothetical protein MR571_04945 [Succinatimonas sp.]|nr:hypothetical protein [Succinatimonas sp.]